MYGHCSPLTSLLTCSTGCGRCSDLSYVTCCRLRRLLHSATVGFWLVTKESTKRHEVVALSCCSHGGKSINVYFNVFRISSGKKQAGSRTT